TDGDGKGGVTETAGLLLGFRGGTLSQREPESGALFCRKGGCGNRRFLQKVVVLPHATEWLTV
ncbi:MAG TPA: hypothetical protein VH643_18510, partial [Gemmataceae bacterium]